MKKYWFIFYQADLLLEKDSEEYTIPFCEEPPVALRAWTNVMDITPMEDGTEVKAFMVSEPIANDSHYEMCPLRQSFYKLSTELYLKAGKCRELLYWDQHTKYCGICGGDMKMSSEISKKCENCGSEVWPQLATAIIVLVHKGDELLLVHAKNFKSDFYGLVAGFVETGETLEEAAHREVLEETNIHIKNLQYFGSQPWPYPCGLMVGFIAEYDGGDIQLQASEISKGNWFHKDSLPQIPERMSIARQIIDFWTKKNS